MEFANPWGLLGLLSLPAIVAIHMFHRRFPPLRIAGSHLWGLETETRAPGRKRERLPVTPSLLLELLAAFVLTMILSRPGIGDLNSVPHLVVVLDNSASMSASVPGELSLRDQALEILDERVAALGRRSVVTLLLTGARPESLSGAPLRWIDARPLLEQWQPHKPQHDFQPTWDIATQLAEDGGHLLFLTNRLPPEDAALPRAMEVVSVGRPLPNAAITMARWKREPGEPRQTINLRVHNFSPQAATVTLRGTASGNVVFTEELRIAARSEAPLGRTVSPGLGHLQIELLAAFDCLEIDNRVELVEPRARPLDVAVTLEAGTAESQAVERVLNAIPETRRAEPDRASLVFAPAAAEYQSRRGLWWFGLGPIDDSDAAREASLNLLSPFLLEKRDPLLDGVVMGGILWGGAQPVERDLAPLISADELPLLGQLFDPLTTAYLMNIDLEYSNLTESPDWPILLNNLASLCRDAQPGLRRWNYRLNEVLRFRAPDSSDPQPDAAAPVETHMDESIVLQGPDLQRRLVRDRLGLVEVRDLSATGVYTIVVNDQQWDQFTVNFYDPQQSDLSRLSGEDRVAASNEERNLDVDTYYTWLMLVGILLVMAAVICDWRVLRPRGY